MLCSEGGQMCAIKEVKVISDDSNSKECLRQLNQVIIYYENIVHIGINVVEETVFPSRTDTSCYVQEIMLLRELSHPNIVQYYGSDLVITELTVIFCDYIIIHHNTHKRCNYSLEIKH